VQIIIIGLLIMATLVGVFARLIYSHRPTQWMKSEEFTDNMNLNEKQKLQDMIDRMEDQKRKLMEYVHDQQLYAQDRGSQMGSLSEIIQKMSARDKNFDLLRLKDLMKQFEDQSSLMIKNGSALVSFNEKQKKAYESNKRFLDEKIEEELRLQQLFIEQQREKNKNLRDKIQEIRSQVQQLHDKNFVSEEAAVFEKLQSLSDNTLVSLDKLDSRREKLKILADTNAIHVASMKDRLDDLKQKNQDSVERNRIHTQDQTQKINDRIHDQMERNKDKTQR
jgi:hypothetical protein